MPSLTRVEAADRAALITVDSYDIELDVTTGDDAFRSVTKVRFRAVESGRETFVELRPVRLLAAHLNGMRLDPTTMAGNRLPLRALAEANELVIEAEMAYSNTGEGLHRFVDPADGGTYLCQTSFLDHAQRMFACFDQPDLKAPVTLCVTAPAGWEVAANGAVDSDGAVEASGGGRDGNRLPGGAVRRWRFARTEPLATYFVTMIAGPFHVLRDRHDGVPLELICRRSLAPHLDKDAEELFQLTKDCLDRFHALFGVRYPFGKYSQAFVPEFNAGAMENPGLVTIRDDYVYRSAVTESDRCLRATTMAHEMAHMWFGDLVTMRWWDDLWLNESFAEYLGVRVTAEATRYRDAWTTFAIRRKGWGYAADQRPSTHPVAPEEVADTAQALLNFDGISYAKGASVLRQFVAGLGDETFLAGLRAHFAANRFGNATLADLLANLSAAGGVAAGTDADAGAGGTAGGGSPAGIGDRGEALRLEDWAAVWLRRAQVNTLHVETRIGEDGRYSAVTVRQTAAPAHPTLRPHRIGLGLYDLRDGVASRRRAVTVNVRAAATTPVPALTGVRVPDLLLLNDGDLTFAKVRLDESSASAVPRVLPALTDPLARAVLWGSVVDAVRDAEVPVTELVELAVSALPTERLVVVVEDVLILTRGLIDRYLVPERREAALRRLAEACELLLTSADPGGSLRLAAARSLIGTATGGGGRLADWLAGVNVPAGLVVDTDLRWRMRYRQAVLGAVGDAEIDAELDTDRSATGAEWAARCRAALPDPAAKARAWDLLVTETAMSARLVEATAQGFWQPEQLAATRDYMPRYFADMPAVVRRRTAWAGEQLARDAFPFEVVEQATRDEAARLLARADLEPGLRRAVTDADDELGRALRARERF